MEHAMTEQRLIQETRTHRGRGGVSAENRSHGFRPAFLDVETSAVYASCFVDGSPAPIHLLDGLPDEVVLARSSNGRVASVKASVVAGFVRSGQFYSREEAGRCLSAETVCVMAA
jgi:hypothetical protein